ncbi:SAVED domain-containing protein [Paenibacillus sp. y28]|uniref:SAVED domain-containing protein n=1 Tax=Paenibacillus sp. y28 TaxID=3129110 RepID=UPI003019E2CC
MLDNSYSDYVGRVKGLGKDEFIARFLYDKVLIEHNWNLNRNDDMARGIFSAQFQRHLPLYDELPQKEISNIYEALLALLKANKARPITRLQIETTIKCAISERFHFDQPPVIISTEIEQYPRESKYLQFKWAVFFGGENRCYPNTEQWNETLLKQLSETSRWITENRSTRKILLKGSRRLSSEMAIGHVFSAVSGFTIEMEYRGERMSTIDFPDSETPDYPFETNYSPGAGERLIVTVGIMKENLKLEVAQFIELNEQGSCPELNLFSASPINSAKQASLAAENIKKEIMSAVLKSNANYIDLFYAGPAYLALFFGHIRNTLPRIQCFERVKVNVYVPTCLI